ncbi:hypothetical protein KSP39_PZI019346 [Platanthera zijinensis]|uniref:Retrotransposon protein, putative, Ty1-copia subclass n=1 Tax=Platanthera zijinensis TaxID=2320716 RepID=A0AAP0B1B0_9ASPA
MIGYIENFERLGFPLGQELATDLILQSLPDSYEQFVLNYNMNEIDKTLPELPGMLRTAEINMKKAKPASPILMVHKGKGKAKGSKKTKVGPKSHLDPKSSALMKKKSTVKEGKCHHCGKAGHWRRNCPSYIEGLQKMKGGMTSASNIYVIEINLSAPSSWVLDTGCGSHICTNVQELGRRRLLSKGEVDLRVGNGVRVIAVAVGVYRLFLSSKMTKAPFTGYTERAEDFLGVVHSDVCGPMSSIARAGYFYFVIFTDDFSRYGYVYIMKCKSETFEKFKEFKNEVENQLGKRVKALRSNRGGEYLSHEFRDYLKECGIVSQLTPPRTPQHNGVSERRNRTLLDMARSMMSHADLHVSFWGFALETATMTLNRAPTKTVLKIPYEIWTGKRPSMSFIKIWGYKAYVRRQMPDKLEPKSDKCYLVGYPKETKGYYFYLPSEGKVFVTRTGVFLEKEFLSRKIEKVELEEVQEPQIVNEPELDSETGLQDVVAREPAQETQVLRRSGRPRFEPERYGFLMSQIGNVLLMDHDDEPATYQEAMNGLDSDKWLEAMKSEMDSMYANQVWNLVEPPEGVRPIGCKWVFKKKTDMDGNSIRILLAIAAYYHYEIWQMDVKTAFLNGNLLEEVYMTQPEGFVSPNEATKVCKLNRSIYGLKQASRSWNLRFDEKIKEFGFIKNEDEPYVYKRISGSIVVFLILYVDDILLIGNDIPTLKVVKNNLGNFFSMKDLSEATYILGIKIFRDRSKKLLGLTQSTYIEKVLKRFNMLESKKGFLPMSHGVNLSKDQY